MIVFEKHNICKLSILFLLFISYIFFYIVGLYPNLFWYFGFIQIYEHILEEWLIRDLFIPSYVFSHILFFFFFLFLIQWISDFRKVPFLRICIILIIFTGLFLRLISLFKKPFTTDLYRYLSDGLQIFEMNNPYINKVLSIDGLSHTNYRTIYPLGAQLIFFLVALFIKNVMGFKVIFGLTELAFVSWYSYKINWNKSHHLKKVFFFWLSPFIIFECYHEGHLDILSIVAMFFAVYFFYIQKIFRTSYRWIIVSVLLSFLVKFYSFLLWPRFILKHRVLLSSNFISSLFYSINFKYLILFFFIAMVTAFPFLHALLYGGVGESGIFIYQKYWIFGNLWIYILKSFGCSQEIAIRVCQWSLLSSVCIFYILWIIKKTTFIFVFYTTILLFLFLFPVQHPWYYLLLLPVFLFSSRYYQHIAWISMSLISINYLLYLK